MRAQVIQRDLGKCVFCSSEQNLTIDHLIPLDAGGIHEVTNFVTACEDCNQRKANISPDTFIEWIGLSPADLPVHGDPVLDNEELPPRIRAVRRLVYDRLRAGEIITRGASTRKRIEKEYRLSLWQTAEGQELRALYPGLPGPVLAMVPEIRTVAKTEREFLLLIELAKNGTTKELIGTSLVRECDVESKARLVQVQTTNEPLKKRLEWALTRFERELKRLNQS